MSDFIERFWQADLGVPGRALALALAPAELMYRTGVRLRNAAYGGVRARIVQHAGVPVVSVGSLRVGGAGKTPFARWVVEHYASRGVPPALLHGGYANDEPSLHRFWNPQVPVIAQRDRVAGARAGVRAGARVLVLDDGFQHRRLARDLDIVLVPVESWVANPHLLPVGPWRESPRALSRADVVVLIHHGASTADIARVREDVAGRARQIPIVVAALVPKRWRAWQDGAHRTPAPGIAVAAIANPDTFLADARRLGGVYDPSLLFRDHHSYTIVDAERIRAAAHGRPVLTTEKDAVKLGVLAQDLDLFVLEQEILFDVPEDVLVRMLDELVVR